MGARAPRTESVCSPSVLFRPEAEERRPARQHVDARRRASWRGFSERWAPCSRNRVQALFRCSEVERRSRDAAHSWTACRRYLTVLRNLQNGGPSPVILSLFRVDALTCSRSAVCQTSRYSPLLDREMARMERSRNEGNSQRFTPDSTRFNRPRTILIRIVSRLIRIV